MSNDADILEFLSLMLPRVERKIVYQKNIVNLLPDRDIDFTPLFTELSPTGIEMPKKGYRKDMNVQWQRLQSRHQGQPKIMPLHLLLISYLRRDTEYTELAWDLFSRLWEEHCFELLQILKTRSIISAMRVFADHSQDPVQRLVAKLGFTYAHLIKLYESERSGEGGNLKTASYPFPGGMPRIGFKSAYGAFLGGDNSFEIGNLILAEEVDSDPIVGPMLATILMRVANSDTIFSRYNKARIAANFKTESEASWSFGYNPKAKT